AEHQIERAVAVFLETVRTELSGAARTPLQLSWQDGPWTIAGEIDGLYAGRLCRFRCANLKAKDVVAAWIEHLLVNLITPGTETVLIDRSSEIRKFRPPTSATQTQTLIKELLATYWRGLTVPLPFFAESSSAYARSMLGQNGGDTQTALRAAARAWSGNAYAGVAGEADDPWNALVFSGFSPLDADFAKLALDIFRPLTEHLDGKLP
ncbi:MAG: hypothetical protein ACKO3O_02810, partial [Gammaproteobacteria bacterium]